MIMNACVRALVICLLVLVPFLGGCHLEQGKLHFDKLNLNPITVYAMKPLETTIYCVAEGDFPSGEILEEMHRQSYQQVENNPVEADWGELVCLSLSRDATVEQMRETINVLLLVLNSRKDSRGAIRGFKKLLEQKVEMVREIEGYQQALVEKDDERKALISSYEDRMNMYELKLILERKETSKQAEKVRDLEQQIQKLKEVELLLQPNKTTN
jgi:hypothetical protein